MGMTVSTAGDWTTLALNGLTTVVDPMVVRTGELFLTGAGGDAATRRWDFLSRNVHALAMFFDTIILERRVPVFNYADTFDMRLNFDRPALDAVNRDEAVLEHVNVEWTPYMAAKQAALAELEKLYEGPRRVPRELAFDVLGELAAAEYDWQPGLSDLEDRLPSPEEKKLAGFLLGGLIFAAYAQTLNGDHVVQPKRSRLLLAVSLGAPRANFAAEEELFLELKRRARSSVTDLPWRPTFFPYLLATCNTPEEVVARAIVLRRSPEVREYKAWLSEALDEWQRNGRLDAKQRDVTAIAKAVDRIITGASAAPTIEMKVSVADVVVGTPPGAVDFTPTLNALWGWTFSRLPGRRYRKLLTRALAADHVYVAIENRLRTVWSA